MSEFLPPRLSAARIVPPWLWWTGLFLLLALMPTSSLLSQDGPGPFFSELGDNIADYDEAQGGIFYSDAFTGRSGEAFGAVGRTGYLTGPGVGREKGLAHLNFMPYLFFDQGMFFADVRGFRSDEDRYGLNAGLGWRQYIATLDRIFGINFYSDYDNTSDTLFRQWGFGIETYGRWLDARANAYFPYGERSRLLRTDLVSGSQRFVGNQLLFDLVNTFGTSLRGSDAEIGIPIPGRFTERHDVRVFAGGYWYDSDATSQFAGWSGRLQGELIPSLLLQLMVTNDSQFDTNVVFAASWSFGGFRQPEDEPRNQFNRMTTPVERKYNVVVARNQLLVPDNIAINPDTGNPYFFAHVASYPPNGPGTVDLPWQTIDQAELVVPVNGDGIIFVHADSIYNGDLDLDGNPDNIVEMLSNVRYLGEGDGIEHTIDIQGVGNDIPLPRATNGVLRPQLLNGVGNGVTLANNSEFSGFLIGNSNIPGSGPTGHGVFGNGVANVDLDQNEINFAGQSGIFLLNTTGRVESAFTRIFMPGGVAFDVQGGTGTITFSGDDDPGTDDIENDGDIALRVENTLAGSFVNLTRSQINNSNSAAQGIFLNNVAGAVTVEDAQIADPTTFGIQILDSSGQFTFRGDIVIGNPGDDAIDITNLAAGGIVQFSSSAPVSISERNQAGFNFFNNAGQIIIDGRVNIGEPAVDINGDPVSNAAAIDWQGNSGEVRFGGDININGSGGDGFALGTVVGNSGDFLVASANRANPSTVAVTGGPNNIGIRGIGVNIANNTATSQVSFGDGVGVAGRFNEGVQIVDNNGLVSFGGLVNVSNNLVNPGTGLLSILPAIDISNNTADITFADVSISDATSNGIDGYGAGMNVRNNIASVTIGGDLDIDNTTNGISLFVADVGDIPNDTDGFFVGAGNITDNTGLPAVDIENSRIRVTFTEVDSSGSARQGIRLVDNAGTGSNFDFVITGVGTTDTTGGTIVNSTLQGVLIDSQGLGDADGDGDGLPDGDGNEGGVANGVTGLSVSLSNMSINSNLLAGVRSVANTEIQLFNDNLNNNGTFGLHAIDTRFIDVEQSVFTNNGGGTNNNFNQMLLEVDTVDADPVDADDTVTGDEDAYEWLLSENDITAAFGGDAILVRTNATASGADLFFRELGDFVRVGNAAIDKTVAGTHVNWDGSIDALFGVVARNNDFEGNQYTLTGAPAHLSGKIGIQFETTSTDPLEITNLSILSNRFTSTSGDLHTAIVIDSDGAANIEINQEARASVGNVIDIDPGLAGFILTSTGMDISAGAGSDIVIANTTMTLSSDIGTAFLFRDIESTTAAPTSIELSGNTVDFDSLIGINAARGVDFQTIRGGNFIFLSSQANNVLTSNFAGQTEFSPNNSSFFRGRFLINGQLFPQ